MTPRRTLTATSLLQRMGTNRTVSQVMRRSVPLDRSIARLTGGRLHLVPRALLPQLILTTTGRRSRQPRTTPLIYIEDGNDYIVVASNFGQNRRPAWSYNLEATPSATITIGRQTKSIHAQRLTESERSEPPSGPRQLRCGPPIETTNGGPTTARSTSTGSSPRDPPTDHRCREPGSDRHLRGRYLHVSSKTTSKVPASARSMKSSMLSA